MWVQMVWNLAPQNTLQLLCEMSVPELPGGSGPRALPRGQGVGSALTACGIFSIQPGFCSYIHKERGWNSKHQGPAVHCPSGDMRAKYLWEGQDFWWVAQRQERKHRLPSPYTHSSGPEMWQEAFSRPLPLTRWVKPTEPNGSVAGPGCQGSEPQGLHDNKHRKWQC